jgi:Ala-tRNA(Pro) deacylase
MSIANRLQAYIAEQGIAWDPVAHQASSTCMEAAHGAHIPPDRVAKAVVLKGKAGYLMAVIPASRQLNVRELGEAVADELALVGEPTLGDLFADCKPGAVPPVGAAYGIRTLWDEVLGSGADVYFEGGDHQTLVHMKGADYGKLMRKAATALPASRH